MDASLYVPPIASNASSSDLLVVGAGVLGSEVCRLWRKAHSNCRVVAETMTAKSHESFRQEDITPREHAAADQTETFPNVVFCVPPGEDYVGEVNRALKFWNKQGNFVFTSSTGLLPQEDRTFNEDSETVPASNPRSKGLLEAEQAVLAAGGRVVRLAGMYNTMRGPHSYWLKLGEVASDPEGVINMIHYDDAADLVARILSLDRNEQRQLFLGCDDHPTTRRALTEAAAATGLFASNSCTFTGPAAPGRQRVFNNRITREITGWKPSWPTMVDYFRTLDVKVPA